LAFNGTNGNLQVGLRFDAPFTRLLERNNYRSILITYQQTRRQLMNFQDTVNVTLRRLLRQLRQLDINLEIQRRAVIIAVRRVDETRETLNEPPAPVEPGQQVVPFGPTAAQNLLTALSDLRNSQNAFMSVWLNHYATRMVLMRELGIMQLDECGAWIDEPFVEDDWLHGDPCPMPPAVPVEWLQEAGVEDEKGDAEDQPLQSNEIEESWDPADGDRDGGGSLGQDAGSQRVIPPTLTPSRELFTPPPGTESAPIFTPPAGAEPATEGGQESSDSAEELFSPMAWQERPEIEQQPFESEQPPNRRKWYSLLPARASSPTAREQRRRPPADSD
jgi:hypothetical protein